MKLGGEITWIEEGGDGHWVSVDTRFPIDFPQVGGCQKEMDHIRWKLTQDAHPLSRSGLPALPPCF